MGNAIMPIAMKMNAVLTALPENLRQLPDATDYEELIAYGERLAEAQEEYNVHIAVATGAMLLAIRDNFPEGKWYEALGRLNINPRTAQMTMRIARDFGDAPELTDGMPFRALNRLTALPENMKEELKTTGRVTLEDGREISITDFKRMVFHDLNNEVINLRNQQNKALKSEEDKRRTAEDEMRAMRGQMVEYEEYVRKLEFDADPAMADEIEKYKQLATDLNTQITELRVKNMRRQQAEENEKALSEAMETAKGAINNFYDILQKTELSFNTPRMNGELGSFIHWLTKSNEIAVQIAGNKLKKAELSDED